MAKRRGAPTTRKGFDATAVHALKELQPINSKDHKIKKKTFDKLD
jgi:hypothetical protein